jgi:hypothetical protein
MTILYDARGNEIALMTDIITGNTVADARVISVSLGSLNAETVLQLNGQSTATFDVRTAAGNLTFQFDGTVDGTNFFPVPAFSQITQAAVTSVAITTTHAVTYMVSCVGLRAVRCRVSAFTSGTIAVAVRGTVGQLPPSLLQVPYPSTTAVTILGAANTGATLTLPAPGVGLYHYITSLEIVRAATAAVVGTALLAYTTTNLSGAIQWSAGNAIAVGQSIIDLSRDFSAPLKSTTANTATTVVAPAAGAGVQVRMNATYFVGA